jgi:beta-xylosidase
MSGKENRAMFRGLGILILTAVAAIPAPSQNLRPVLPKLEPVFDFPLRDPSIDIGPDGMYYLTGTTGWPNWWKTNEGIRIWKSADLKAWTPLGLVWSLHNDAEWAKDVKEGNRAVWAPEIHYLKGTFWLTYCMNYRGGGTGLLKSVTGAAEGPYVDVKPDGPLTNEIDASLFQDEDGAVYWVYQDGKIARMKDDMTDLAEQPRLLVPSNWQHVGFEGAFIFKANGRYHLIAAEFNELPGDPGKRKVYDCMGASSGKIYGPYTDRYLAVPHGGHNMIFRDRQNRWWSTIFGSDEVSPIHERFGLVRIEFGPDGHIRPIEGRP